MALPTAVAKQEELADRLYQSAYGEKEPEAKEPEAKAPEQQPEEQPATEPQPKKEPAWFSAEFPEETWEARFKSLYGKYQSEVTPMAQRAREAKAKVDDLTAKLNAAMKRIDDLESAAAKQPLVKPEEVQEFGEPLVDLVRRAAREEIANATPRKADGDIEGLRSELEEIKLRDARSAEERFFIRLAELVPDWVTVNGDPKFHAWLAQKAPYSREERQALLSRAQAACDADTVAEFFRDFVGEGQSRAAAAERAREEQVVPSAQSSAAKPMGKVVFTRREIAQFYADWRAKRIDDAEAVARDAEIQVALREGRVR